MDPRTLNRISDHLWEIPQTGDMKVPGRIFASENLISGMDEKVREQVMNVACLPGIQVASLAMPDAHWGYGFPIGGVAAFDPEEGGIISMGGVGFDISCGVRTMKTGMMKEEVLPRLEVLVDQFYARVPAGVGSEGLIKMSAAQIDEMLLGGAEWAVKKGYGVKEDLAYIDLFQDLDVQFTDQRLGSGRRFDKHAVAGNDPGRVLNQDFCKICYSSIRHKISPLSIANLQNYNISTSLGFSSTSICNFCHVNFLRKWI